MKQGDLVTVALRGDYGKPRPAVVVQSDDFSDTDSVTLLLITSTLRDASYLRVNIDPSEGNGLRKPSQVQIDRLMSTRRDRVGPVFGNIGEKLMLDVDRQLLSFLGLVR